MTTGDDIRTIPTGARARGAQAVERGGKGDAVREKLLSLLVQHSYEHADYQKFKLASGTTSDTYINCKATTTLAKAGRLIGEVCAGLVPSEAEAIGGLTMGADAIAYAISAYFAYTQSRTLDSFVVRKTPKEHGKKLWIEGNPGQSVVVVDDVVTTGGSTIMAIERCREADIKVLAVIVLVDREEGDGIGKVRKAAGGVPVHAIFTKSELEKQWSSAHADHAGANPSGPHAAAS